LGKGVERKSGATELLFEATSRFAVVEVNLVVSCFLQGIVGLFDISLDVLLEAMSTPFPFKKTFHLSTGVLLGGVSTSFLRMTDSFSFSFSLSLSFLLFECLMLCTIETGLEASPSTVPEVKEQKA